MISYLAGEVLGVDLVRSRNWILNQSLHCCIQYFVIAGPWSSIKISYQYRKSHCGDNSVVRWSISTVGFPILLRWHLHIESAPLSCYSGAWQCQVFFKTYFLYSFHRVTQPNWNMSSARRGSCTESCGKKHNWTYQIKARLPTMHSNFSTAVWSCNQKWKLS